MEFARSECNRVKISHKVAKRWTFSVVQNYNNIKTSPILISFSLPVFQGRESRDFSGYVVPTFGQNGYENCSLFP